MGMKLISSWTFSGFCQFCVLLCWIDDLGLKRYLCRKNVDLRMGRPMGMPSGPSHGKGGGKHEEILGEFFGVVKSFNPDKGWLRQKDPHRWGKTEHPRIGTIRETPI